MVRLLTSLSTAALLAGSVHAVAQPYYAPPAAPYYAPPAAPYYAPRGEYRPVPRGPGFHCAAGPRNVICDLADPPRPLGSPCACEPPVPGRPPLPGQVIR